MNLASYWALFTAFNPKEFVPAVNDVEGFIFLFTTIMPK